jgi:hypothetical protein
MKFDLLQLLYVFDEELPLSDEEQGFYWFKYTREDKGTIQLNFSIFESKYGLILRSSEDIAIASVMLQDCEAINVLDEKNRQLEIVSAYTHGWKLRCFLDFEGENVMELEAVPNNQ